MAYDIAVGFVYFCGISFFGRAVAASTELQNCAIIHRLIEGQSLRRRGGRSRFGRTIIDRRYYNRRRMGFIFVRWISGWCCGRCGSWIASPPAAIVVAASTSCHVFPKLLRKIGFNFSISSSEIYSIISRRKTNQSLSVI
jgi:hypothetical protein